MATITEDYCSFEIAKLLKEKGFDEHCSTSYNTILSNHKVEESSVSECGRANQIYCPTLQMAMKWLREVHKIHIIAEPCLGEGDEPNLSFNRWFWTILKEEGEYEPIRKIEEFSTYEEAVEAALEYSLKNLI